MLPEWKIKEMKQDVEKCNRFIDLCQNARREGEFWDKVGAYLNAQCKTGGLKASLFIGIATHIDEYLLECERVESECTNEE